MRLFLCGVVCKEGIVYGDGEKSVCSFIDNAG